MSQNHSESSDRLDRIERAIEELVASQKETDQQLQRTDQQLERLGQKIGELTGGWGHFVEGPVGPGVEKMLEEIGYEIDGFMSGTKRRTNGKSKTLEVDHLAIAHDPEDQSELLVAVEVKSYLKASDIDNWVASLNEFDQFFPEYRDRRLFGAVAGIRIAEGADRYAIRQGLYVFVPSGDIVTLANPPDFRPRVFVGQPAPVH